MAPTRRIISLFLTLLLSLTSALLHHSAIAATLSAPAQANADSPLTITLDGVDNPRDFVTIVSASAAEGHYDTYAYTSNGNSVELFAPLEPGDYEIRWLAAESPYATRARHTLKVVAVSASVTAPASAAIASTISIEWQGPNHPRDFITMVPAGSAEGSYDAYTYTSKGSPLTLTAPTQPGNYEIRYLSGRGYKTLGRTAIAITDTSASVQFTSPARIGQQLSVQWSGPANPREYITVVKAGSGEREYAQYTYVDKGNPLQLQLPDVPGEYEVRYLTADASRVLARAPLTIEAVTASVDGPASAVARPQQSAGLHRHHNARQTGRVFSLRLHRPWQSCHGGSAETARHLRHSLSDRAKQSIPGPHITHRHTRQHAGQTAGASRQWQQHCAGLRRGGSCAGCLGQHAAEAGRQTPHRHRQDHPQPVAGHAEKLQPTIRAARVWPPQGRRLRHRTAIAACTGP
jgi:methionine-rich copper-binding protein CopC